MAFNYSTLCMCVRKSECVMDGCVESLKLHSDIVQSWTLWTNCTTCTTNCTTHCTANKALSVSNDLWLWPTLCLLMFSVPLLSHCCYGRGDGNVLFSFVFFFSLFFQHHLLCYELALSLNYIRSISTIYLPAVEFITAQHIFCVCICISTCRVKLLH